MLTILLPVVLAAAPAWASDAGSDARFSELDANNDGKLSRDEYAVLEREAMAKKGEQPAAAQRSSAAGASK